MFDTFDLWLIVAVLAADCLTTIVGISHGASEANPGPRWVYSRIGLVPGVVSTRILLGGLMWYLAPICGPTPMWWAFAFIAAVQVNNLYVISRR